MASDTDKTLQDAAGADFVLLDETELHLPEAGDAVLVGDGARDSFWQPAADEALPALDELISDHAATPLPLPGDHGAPGAPVPDVFLLSPAEGLPAVGTSSLVDIVVDDGSGGPLVA